MPISLNDAEELQNISEKIDRVMSSEDYFYYLETKAEIEAENAWLKFQENRLWMDEYYERY